MSIAVAMSGGVDSSVAAAILVEGGHRVVGFTLKVWEHSRCCSVSDVEDARRVASHLGIPFYVLDAHGEFEAEVVAPFIDAYARGLTPNPCILCNRRIKFRWLLDRARALGCEQLATGHYARLRAEPWGASLWKGVDLDKDQSYFLVPEEPGGLAGVGFPLGGLRKEEVRERAAGARLPVARKPESQDVCFVPEGDLGTFLEARLGEREGGAIVDLEGRVLGEHRGVHGYTVGQRRGLGIASRRPLYVLEKDAAARRLVVGPRERLLAREFTVRDAVWLADPGASPSDGRRLECSVKVRSTGREVPCIVVSRGDHGCVRLQEPEFAIAPGQMAVFYEGDRVLGGGWIEGTVIRDW